MNDDEKSASVRAKVRELRLGDQVGKGKRGSGGSAWLPWLLCFMLAGAWASLGVRYSRTPDTIERPASADTPSAPKGGPATSPPVNSVPAPATAPSPTGAPASDAFGKPPQAPTDEIRLENRGYIVPAHQISISPIDVAGRLIKVSVEEGRKMNKGDELARIDPTSYEALYSEAKAMVASADAKLAELTNGSRPAEILQVEAELAEARANLRQYELDYKRSREMRVGAISPKEFEAAEASYEAGRRRTARLEQSYLLIKEGPRKERIDGARAELDAAKARLASADFRLKNCIIVAPITGIILTKKAEEGNLINPVIGGVSTSLCEMANLAELEVDMEIQERDLPKVFVGQACRVKADAFPDRVYIAYVDRILPTANRSKGILPARIRIVLPPEEEQGRYLKPEMGVTVTFLNRASAEHAKDKASPRKEEAVLPPAVPKPPVRKPLEG